MPVTVTSSGRERLQNLSIRHFAEELLIESGAMPGNSDETVQLKKVLNHLGFGYFEFDPTASNDRDLSRIKGAVIHKAKKIFLNSTLSPQEKNFALAHEIGHIRLHGSGDRIDFLQHELTEIPNEEIEANIFAYELLMPIQFFNHNVKKHANNIEALADFYCVTEKRINKRINFEKKLNEALHRKLQVSVEE